MAAKKLNYKDANGSGWREKADDIFLAQFRGRPCMICKDIDNKIVTETKFYDKKLNKTYNIRTMGHHLFEKDHHKIHRYDEHFIITLCVNHHTKFAQGERAISPHAHDTVPQARFYWWLKNYRSNMFDFLVSTHLKEPVTWTYRDEYVRLGGEIKSKTGFKKDLKPVNHKANVRRVENDNR